MEDDAVVERRPASARRSGVRPGLVPSASPTKLATVDGTSSVEKPNREGLPSVVSNRANVLMPRSYLPMPAQGGQSNIMLSMSA
jgi:hypothetical protein